MAELGLSINRVARDLRVPPTRIGEIVNSGAPTDGKSKKLSQGIFARETISSLAFCLRMTCNVGSRLLGVDQNSRSDSAIVGVIMGNGTAQWRALDIAVLGEQLPRERFSSLTHPGNAALR